MEHHLYYKLEGVDSLRALLEKGLTGFATQTAEHGRFTSIWLFLHKNIVLEIHSSMTDIESWQEVGTLLFRRLDINDNHPPQISLDSVWANIKSLDKLIIKEDAYSAESGMVIRNNNDEELIIVCGAYPYTLEMLAPFCDFDFQPEYDFNLYSKKNI